MNHLKFPDLLDINHLLGKTHFHSKNKDNESMLLYTAVDKGHLEVVKCLVPKSAEIHKNTEFLEYYLKQAIENDHSEIAEYITSLM